MAETFDVDGFLELWFADTRTQPESIPGRMEWWFGVDEERDERLASMVGDACVDARRGELAGVDDSPSGQLALILLLDQVPRNLYRGTAEAFASDEEALALCLDGHSRGLDESLSLIERAFFWMPLQHAEDLERQELGVQLFGSLAASGPERDALWTEFARYAELHHDIIQRFGRFPHRNEALGRPTTDREEAWLEEGGARFGQ